MAAHRILLLQGHPDPAGGHFLHALAGAYAEGAGQADIPVRAIDVARLDFPVLRTQADWETGTAVPDIQSAQEAIKWCDHMAIFYPLWLGGMPALLKAFLEQALRPGFAISSRGDGSQWRRLLAGRSARVVVTMGMPAPVYRWFFMAHSLKSLERNILALCGIRPVRESLIGMVASNNGAGRARWLARMRELGREGR